MREGLENARVVSQGTSSRNAPDKSWSFDSMMESLSNSPDLGLLVHQFRENFFQVMEAMSERSEVRGFKAAYDQLSRNLGENRDKVFCAHVFVKYSGSDTGINIANNGTIYIMKIGRSGESLISRNPPLSKAMPPTADNPQLNWEPIDDEDLCLLVYNYAAALAMYESQKKLIQIIRDSTRLEIARELLSLELRRLQGDAKYGWPMFLLIPLKK